MKIGWVFAGVALLTATGAVAQDANQQASSKDNEVQCRYERVTGSRTKARRMCMTRAEWRQHMEAEKEEFDRLKGSGASTGMQGFGGGAN